MTDPIQAIVEGSACGFVTKILARSSDGISVHLDIKSDCPQVMALAAKLDTLDAFEQVLRKPFTETIPARLAVDAKLHATCLVPIGILKAVEAAAGLALPSESTIKLEKANADS